MLQRRDEGPKSNKREIRPKWDKTKLVSHSGRGSYVKGEEEEEAKKGLDTCLDLQWFCLNFSLFHF